MRRFLVTRGGGSNAVNTGLRCVEGPQGVELSRRAGVVEQNVSQADKRCSHSAPLPHRELNTRKLACIVLASILVIALQKIKRTSSN
jgi:hypothetical protein